MVHIKVYFKDGSTCYIDEIDFYRKLGLSQTVPKFAYQSISEFKVSWDLTPADKFNKSDVIKFEALDAQTYEFSEFDLTPEQIKSEYFVPKHIFDNLIYCPIGSSNFVRDKDDNWITKDFDNAHKQMYLKRGIIACLSSHNNWFSRYTNGSWHSSYKYHHPLMLCKFVQDIYLSKLSSCDTIIFYKIED
jgi:hypothetical protein